MCNLYRPPPPNRIQTMFASNAPGRPYAAAVGPLKPGPYIKGAGRCEVGQWGMIPADSEGTIPKNKRTGQRISTNNCRSEDMLRRATFAGPWRNGQRCLIPAESFDEPYWGTGANVWWRFSRADGTPLALAGMWAEWTDPATGEVFPSYTMLTQNCDAHPVLKLMHRPELDKKTGLELPADQQDKRSVVPIEAADWDEWLHGSPEQAMALIRLPAADLFLHGAADPGKQVQLPI